MRRYLLLLPLLLAVAACKTTGSTEIESARLECKDEPAIPEGEITDAKNGAYLRGMRAAWADCRGKLHWVRDYVKGK